MVSFHGLSFPVITMKTLIILLLTPGLVALLIISSGDIPEIDIGIGTGLQGVVDLNSPSLNLLDSTSKHGASVRASGSWPDLTCQPIVDHVLTSGMCDVQAGQDSCFQWCKVSTWPDSAQVCSCDAFCVAYGDCCADFRSQCPDEADAGLALTAGWKNYSSKCVRGFYKVIVSTLVSHELDDLLPWTTTHVGLDNGGKSIVFASHMDKRLIMPQKESHRLDKTLSRKYMDVDIRHSPYSAGLSVKDYLFLEDNIPLFHPTRASNRGCFFGSATSCESCLQGTEVPNANICLLNRFGIVNGERRENTTEENNCKDISERPSYLEPIRNEEISIMQRKLNSDIYTIHFKNAPWKIVSCKGSLNCRVDMCGHPLLKTLGQKCMLPESIEIHEVKKDRMIIQDDFFDSGSSLVAKSSCHCKKLFTFLRLYYLKDIWNIVTNEPHMLFHCIVNLKPRRSNYWYGQGTNHHTNVEIDKSDINAENVLNADLSLRHIPTLDITEMLDSTKENNAELASLSKDIEELGADVSKGKKRVSKRKKCVSKRKKCASKRNKRVSKRSKRSMPFSPEALDFKLRISRPPPVFPGSQIAKRTRFMKKTSTKTPKLLQFGWKRMPNASWDFVEQIEEIFDIFYENWEGCNTSAENVILLCVSGFTYNPNQTGEFKSKDDKVCFSMDTPFHMIEAFRIRKSPDNFNTSSSFVGCLMSCVLVCIFVEFICFLIIN